MYEKAIDKKCVHSLLLAIDKQCVCGLFNKNLFYIQVVRFFTTSHQLMVKNLTTRFQPLKDATHGEIFLQQYECM